MINNIILEFANLIHAGIWRENHALLHFLSTLPQIIDVFTDKTVMLKDSTDFVVSVNPTGVVMWYVSAPAKLNLRQLYKGGKLHHHTYDDEENAIPRVFL